MDMYSIENVIQESLEGIKGRSRPSKIPLNTEESEFREASEVTADNENLEVNELTIDEKGKVLKETQLAEVVPKFWDIQ